MFLIPRLTLAGLSIVALTAAAVPDLKRSVRLGVAPQPLGEGEAARVGRPGVIAAAVLPDGNGAAAGLVAGDVVLAVNGRSTPSPTALTAAGGALRGGEPLVIDIWRDGKLLTLRARAVGRPWESYPGAKVTYGAIPFEGGYLREIVALPDGVTRPPIVYLIQGYNCGPVEQPAGHGYTQLVRALLAAGLGVYRIDKPGAGDSEGPVPCEQAGFETEVRAFEAGWRALRDRHDVAPERAFLFGHSIGGLIAPLIAARNPPPRGVALFGGVVRNWEDYLNAAVAFQSFELRGTDPAEGEAFAMRARAANHLFFTGREPPAQILAKHPEMAEAVRLAIGWTDGDDVAGRHYRYWQEIAATPLVAAWRDTRAYVLALYGESDITALNAEDHRLIAEIVNHYRPGTARFVTLPRTDHGMMLAGTRAEIRSRAASAPATFNPAVADELIRWIRSVLDQPRVITS